MIVLLQMKIALLKFALCITLLPDLPLETLLNLNVPLNCFNDLYL